MLFNCLSLVLKGGMHNLMDSLLYISQENANLKTSNETV